MIVYAMLDMERTFPLMYLEYTVKVHLDKWLAQVLWATEICVGLHERELASSYSHWMQTWDEWMKGLRRRERQRARGKNKTKKGKEWGAMKGLWSRREG